MYEWVDEIENDSNFDSKKKQSSIDKNKWNKKHIWKLLQKLL